ncbi:MAG: SMC-Scp complex subunit ScpB [Micrococcales bacterium]|nr:SMC-Scp complex subunit ScpB [Micrococcales bacterium]
MSDAPSRASSAPDISGAALDSTDESVEAHRAFDVDDAPGGVRSALEAVLMVVDEPVPELALAAALEVPVDDVRAHLRNLEQEYAADQRGFTLRDVAGGWRMYSRSEFAPVVEKFVLDGQQARLTQASLETLAVIAYRQPVARGRVSAVRGVNVDGVVRTLISRGLIEELSDPGEGGAVLYGTTPYFLQRMGLRSLDELPDLAPYLPDADLLDELNDEGRS